MASKVFIAGANGYIGFGVALSFRRHGYQVYGLIRHESQSSKLIQNEIFPVIGNMNDPTTYQHYLDQCSIIIDAVGYCNTARSFLDYVQSRAVHNNSSLIPDYKPLFIFTSGIMTYGNAMLTQKLNMLDESTRPSPTIDWTCQRRDYENHVMLVGNQEKSPIRTVVLRPGFVYGSHGGVVANNYFKVEKEGDLVMYGSPSKRWSWVHIDDLGDGYVLVAKKHGLNAELFNLAVNDNPTYEELRIAMAKSAGWVGKAIWKDVPPDDIGLNTYENTVIVSFDKAMNVLGWNPKRWNFLSEVNIYYQAWLAHQNEK